MKRTEIFHPDFSSDPYWWEAAPPTTEGAEELPPRCEVLVVGSGYAGLNAALELARSGRDVCVVEAHAFGFGASSRNGGAVSAGVNLGKGISGSSGQTGRDAASKAMLDALMVQSAGALEHVETVIEREAIECDYQASGRFVGAYTPAHFEDLKPKVDELNEVTGSPVRLLSREEQRQEIGSDFYFGGMLVDRSGKLHPALYHRGLLDACRRQGVTLVANTEVSAVTGREGEFRIRTTAGECAAEQVVIATNGYTGSLTPNLRRRIVPVASHIIATEELPEDLAQGLAPAGRTLSETPRILHYYRQSPDGRRMIFGGRARFTTSSIDVTAPILYAEMVARYPQLEGYRITHCWSGLVAFTVDSVPHLGRERGMHYCMGCNGSGVAMLSYLGFTVARRIMTDGAYETAYAGRPFPAVPVPLYSGNPWFLPLLGGYYRFLDRRERRAALDADRFQGFAAKVQA